MELKGIIYDFSWEKKLYWLVDNNSYDRKK